MGAALFPFWQAVQRHLRKSEPSAQAAADAVFVLHVGNAHNLVLFLDCRSENNTFSN
jgi:hypothetical protein